MPAPKKILVADDETNLRRVLGAILKREGHQVLSAENGAEALELLARNDVDAVITDLRMPKVDGMELLERTVADYPDVPVIVLTAAAVRLVRGVMEGSIGPGTAMAAVADVM